MPKPFYPNKYPWIAELAERAWKTEPVIVSRGSAVGKSSFVLPGVEACNEFVERAGYKYFLSVWADKSQEKGKDERGQNNKK